MMAQRLSILALRLTAVGLLLQIVSAQNYGDILQLAGTALNKTALVRARETVHNLDLASLKSFSLMLEEYATMAGALKAEGLSESEDLCQLHIGEIVKGLTANPRQDWAVRMIDAAGKPQSGIVNGNILWIGNYDECVNITATVYTGPNGTNPTHPFKGQYCKAILPLSNSSEPGIGGQIAGLTLGVCVPSTCSNTSIVNITRGVFPYVQCVKEELEFDTRAIVATVFLSLLGCIVLAGTAYDIFVIHKLHVPEMAYEETGESTVPLISHSNDRGDNSSARDIRYRGYGSVQPGSQEKFERVALIEPVEIGIGGKLLQAFSLYTNGSKILATETREGTLGALNGVRFFSMSWVTLGHVYAFPFTVAANTVPFIMENINRLSFMTLVNATVSVDSFFTLSGLLVGYLTLRELAKVGGALKFKWHMYYFHRFWRLIAHYMLGVAAELFRLTPPYMLVILLYVPLMKYWSSGPLWPEKGLEKNYCEGIWWQNLLYINNFFPMMDQCMGWSWYLANDMQFYVISPLLLIPLHYSSVVGTVVCFFALLSTWTATGVVSSENNLSELIFTQTEMQLRLYIRPYYRIGPYIIGMLFGAVLAKTNCKVRMSKLINILGWLVAAGCCLSVLYANFDAVRGKRVDSVDVQALYNTLSRSAWAVGVSWVVFACATGYGGIVNKFLSWKLFLPLSRLTYMTYLIHPVVIFTYYFGKRQLIYLTHMELVFCFLGIMVVTYTASFVLSMVFESPFMGLERVLLKRERKH